MKKKAPSKILKPGELNFCDSTIQTLIKGQDVDEDVIEAAIIFTHLILGINAYVNPTACLGTLIEALSVGMDDQSALEYGRLIARTASIAGSNRSDDKIQ